jgi:hypothetical protein
MRMTPSTARTLGDSLNRVDTRIRDLLSQPTAALIALLIVVLFAHGYEIFNLHLTIDEELHLDTGRRAIAELWIAQGRWGMGIVTTLIPSSVVPVVSPGLGVGLLALSLWLTVERAFGADRCASVCAVSVAITLPVLPFTMSFATFAHGIGFACLAASGFILLIRRANHAVHFTTAALLAAFAISVYQPMIFALAALVVVDLCRTDLKLADKTRLRGVLTLVGALGLYFLIDQIVRRVLQADMTQYVDSYIDLKGLLAHPLDRITRATRDTWSVFHVPKDLFVLHSPGLELFMGVALLACVRTLILAKGTSRSAPLITAMLLLALPTVAEMVSTYSAPLRSMVYLPFVVALIGTMAFMISGTGLRLSLYALTLLAVLGNSDVNNRLYAAGNFAYERDRFFAHDIMREIEKVVARDKSSLNELRLEVVGIKSWQDSPLIPKRETLGASFFEWGGVSRSRTAAFLRDLGFDIRDASDTEIVPVVPIAIEMPSWPADGWVRHERNLLIVKLGEYTPSQKRMLCSAGAKELCP